MPASPETLARYREVRLRLRRLLCELVAKPHRDELRDPMRPVHLRVYGRRTILVLEAEKVVGVRARALVRDVAEYLIALVDRLRESRLQALLPHHREDRHFVVVTAIRLAGRMRIVAEQRGRLRADPILWDRIASERKTRDRIDDLHRSAGGVAALREVARPLERCRHQPWLRQQVVVGHALESNEDVEAIPQAGHLDRSAERAQQMNVVVVGSRRRHARERVGSGVPEGVAEQATDRAVVEGASAPPIVAEGGRLRERRGSAIVHAAIDQESICGRGRICRRIIRCWRGRLS